MNNKQVNGENADFSLLIMRFTIRILFKAKSG